MYAWFLSSLRVWHCKVTCQPSAHTIDLKHVILLSSLLCVIAAQAGFRKASMRSIQWKLKYCSAYQSSWKSLMVLPAQGPIRLSRFSVPLIACIILVICHQEMRASHFHGTEKSAAPSYTPFRCIAQVHRHYDLSRPQLRASDGCWWHCGSVCCASIMPWAVERMLHTPVGDSLEGPNR